LKKLSKLNNITKNILQLENEKNLLTFEVFEEDLELIEVDDRVLDVEDLPEDFPCLSKIFFSDFSRK
jgi:hypothetical protein